MLKETSLVQLFCFFGLFIFVCGEIKDRDVLRGNPPPIPEKARTARYLVHNTDWTVIATISTQPNITGNPFTNVWSFCDGSVENSTGIPYFYVMKYDDSMVDILKYPYLSITVTEAMIGYCKKMSYDAEDPRCARVTLTGKMVNVTSHERDFALQSLFSRHPSMRSWSKAHDFFPVKLDINLVRVLDTFGGAYNVPLSEYYAVKL